MNLQEYNTILNGVYKRAAKNKFIDGLKDHSIDELRPMLLDARQKELKFEGMCIDEVMIKLQLNGKG
jgi:hypothetical protein